MRHIRFLASLAPVAFLALGCGEKAPDGPEVAPVGAETTAAGDAEALAQETRDKLFALAVASECLRKGGAPPEEAANQMLALYKEKAIELTTYTIEMQKLASDPAFAAAVDAKTKECPTVITPDATAEVADAASDGGPDALAAAPDAVGAADATVETSADTVVAAVDTAVAETIADTTPATPETVAIADTVAPIADTRVAPPPDTVVALDTVAPEVVAPPEEISYSGTWTGGLTGGGTAGSLRVAINGRTITSAVASFGRTTVRLKGTISAKGALSLGGTSGQNFVRITGKVGAGGRAISGTWDGVVDKKKSNGRFTLKR